MSRPDLAWRDWIWVWVGVPVAVGMFFWVRFAAERFALYTASIPSWIGTAFYLALLVGLGLYIDHLFPEEPEDP